MINDRGTSRRRWAGRFVVLCLVLGIGGAVAAYLGMAAAWSGCEEDLDAGGRFAVNFLGVAGLFVMPTVGVLTGAMAAASHRWIARSRNLRHLGDVVPSLITLAGIATLLILIGLWVMWGGPADGSCDRPGL
ncbi:hypothetical protein ABZ801_20120 [Actinomadura sp. NPDC047616]|uniref:hypothetical protein n=1 Tax=Actinomadura sp. NPDC047616 TaxID=3155914 RepID=UPI0034006779